MQRLQSVTGKNDSRALARLMLRQGDEDLKNEQWALEPLSDIVISLSIMKMGFTLYKQLSDGDHKNKMNQFVEDH